MLPFLVNTIAPAVSVLSRAAIRTLFQEERDGGRRSASAHSSPKASTALAPPLPPFPIALLSRGKTLVFEAVVLTLGVVARRRAARAVDRGASSPPRACSPAARFAAPRLQRFYPAHDHRPALLALALIGLTSLRCRTSPYCWRRAAEVRRGADRELVVYRPTGSPSSPPADGT